MARRLVYLVTALALFIPIGIGAAQHAQLPKTVSLSVVEKDSIPHRLHYKSATQVWDVQGTTVRVTANVDGRALIVMTDGRFTVSSPDKSQTKQEVFRQLELRFAADGNMIEFKVTP